MTTTALHEPMFPQFFINPIKTLHKLKDAGFTEKQAEAQIEILVEQAENIEAAIATKRELRDLEYVTKRDLKELELRIEIRFKEIDAKLRELEMKLTIRMGAITSSVVGFFYLLEKFF